VTEVVLLEVSERIATVTLNRPEARNALSSEVLRRLPVAMAEADARDDVDVILLTGADPAFCAGLDLKELGTPGSNLGGAVPPDQRGPFPRLAKPVIGAINGVAVTGGLELVLNCDLLVASTRARFGDTHARVGLMPGWGLTVLLAQAVGVRRAREMSWTGNFLSAEDALAAGLVNHVVEHEELLPFSRRLAADIAGNEQDAVRQLKRTYAAVAEATVEEGWRIEAADARAWRDLGFDPEEVARRRDAIITRGRTQTRTN
jgi:enoyl-CoA hydratase